MKRKLFLLSVIILSLSLFLTACGQKDIGEAKAKEIALAYINKVFNANETEILVTREQKECYSDEAGALATPGNSEVTARWVYIARVPWASSMTKYEAYVVASTGEVIYARQHEVNIILNDEQKEQAYKLYAREPKWGEKHEEALQELNLACYDLAAKLLDESRPIVLETDDDRVPGDSIQRTFSNAYYVVTRDGRVYLISIYWPSIQVMSISVVNSN